MLREHVTDALRASFPLFTDRTGSAALDAEIEASIIRTRQKQGAGRSKHPHLP